MSGAVSVGAAVIAIGTAAGITAEVGLTVGAAFAITAAVGATVGAVGAITHVKELQYAGAALGAVGLVGGLAGAAGLFDTGASLFGASGGEFGGIGGDAAGFMGGGGGGGFMGGAEGGAFMGGAPSAATDAGTWAGVDLGQTSGTDVPKFDAVAMANGQAPEVAPPAATDTIGNQVLQSSVPSAPEPGAPPTSQDVLQSSVASADTPPPPTTQDFSTPVTGRVTDTTPKTLLNGSPTDQPAFLDENGRLATIPQGDPNLGNDALNAPGDVLRTQGQPAQAPPVTGRTGVAGVDQPNTLGGTPAPNGPYQATMGPNGSSPTLGLQAGATQPTSPMPSLSDPSIWASIGDFVKNNQALSYGAIQAAGSFLSGSLSPLPQAQVEELESRKKQNEAAAALYNQQAALLQQRLANMSAPMPIASRSLLNGGGAVTGRVA